MTPTTVPSGSRGEIPPLAPRGRLLLGPGPSNVHPTVSEALAKPLVGHLDPQFLRIMDQVQDMLRRVFMTENTLTLAVSGTGSAGMEATIVNLVEPGDEVLVCVNGLFGGRMAEIAERCGAVVHRLERDWGDVFSVEEIDAKIDARPEIRLVTVVHAETSTGALQPLRAIGECCRRREKLLLVDAVTSLGGTELRIDDWKIDACYSGTQKCLSCPPGLAPVTIGPRAVVRMARRKRSVQSWYLDFSLLQRYWSDGQRAYHHTAPIAMNYALHQALRLVLEEGLTERWRRHRRHGRALVAGLEALGFQAVAAEDSRLPMLTAVRLPEGLEEAKMRSQLLDDWNIEIGGGLGPLAGTIWRIGLMGESARRTSVFRLLGALEEILYREGLRASIGASLEAAAAAYRDS